MLRINLDAAVGVHPSNQSYNIRVEFEGHQSGDTVELEVVPALFNHQATLKPICIDNACPGQPWKMFLRQCPN
jgi:hypothetical protein